MVPCFPDSVPSDPRLYSSRYVLRALLARPYAAAAVAACVPGTAAQGREVENMSYPLSCPVFLVACQAIRGSTARATFCAPYWLGLMPLLLWLPVFLVQPHKEESRTRKRGRKHVQSIPLSCPVFLVACQAIRGPTARATFCAPYWLGLMPLLLWLPVFLVQPHKEERFLYPVYSMIVLAGAIALDCLQKMTFAVGTELFRWRKERERLHYLSYTGPLMVMCVLLAGLGGISRTVSLYNNYHAPMSILRSLPESAKEQVVCFGKEWYPTRLIHPYFNDLNKMDNSTYLPPQACHYLVDSDTGHPSPLQPHYHRDTAMWETITTLPILDADKSHKIFRAFYIPYLSKSTTTFANLYLLKNKLIV
ncbi:alg9-like mannosyltransferase family domain-containing protein [Phthorimaea operculella]|nr:alg9-like mannosyltransferase family domain-containing protein [Phthorimaea operculella]